MPSIATVYHFEDQEPLPPRVTPGLVREHFLTGKYTCVACVWVDESDPQEVQLEDAYRVTQHLNVSWWLNTEIQYTRHDEYNPARSTMIGDIITLKDQIFMVDRIGFTRLVGLHP